jgi:hypothetical protein
MAAGLATALLCPDPSCRLAAAPGEVKALLTPDEFDTYEKTILESSLAGVSHPALTPPSRESGRHPPSPYKKTGKHHVVAGRPVGRDGALRLHTGTDAPPATTI